MSDDFYLYINLFHDLLSAPMFHHSVWSVITAHKLTPAKRDVTAPSSAINGHASLHRVSAIITLQTLWRNIGAEKSRNKCTGQAGGQRNSPVTAYTHKTNNETKHQSHANLQPVGSKQPNLFTDVPRE